MLKLVPPKLIPKISEEHSHSRVVTSVKTFSTGKGPINRIKNVIRQGLGSVKVCATSSRNGPDLLSRRIFDIDSDA
jgi:hypothetical protein